MKHNRSIKIAAILLIINLAATCILGGMVYRSSHTQTDTAIQYVMYVGTNDKDTYEQIIPTEEAKAMIDAICYKYLDGYTLQDAVGSWADETGTPTHENTIVCYFDDADEKTVYSIADEIIKALNQNTVLIEKGTVNIDFYGGK